MEGSTKKRKRQSILEEFLLTKDDEAEVRFKCYHHRCFSGYTRKKTEIMIIKGGKFCRDFDSSGKCILEKGLGNNLLSLYETHKHEFNIEKKKSQFSAHAFRVAMNHLNILSRASLSICVVLEVMHLFGECEGKK